MEWMGCFFLMISLASSKALRLFLLFLCKTACHQFLSQPISRFIAFQNLITYASHCLTAHIYLMLNFISRLFLFLPTRRKASSASAVFLALFNAKTSFILAVTSASVNVCACICKLLQNIASYKSNALFMMQ